jgi:hypothetical protein
VRLCSRGEAKDWDLRGEGDRLRGDLAAVQGLGWLLRTGLLRHLGDGPTRPDNVGGGRYER